ncbi:MAG: hypothetical protein WD810_08330 [Solirubrobacterales bacterium]
MPTAGEPVDLGSLACADMLEERRAALLDALESLMGLPRDRHRPLGRPAPAGPHPLLPPLGQADPEAAASIAADAGFEVELAVGNLDVIVPA